MLETWRTNLATVDWLPVHASQRLISIPLHEQEAEQCGADIPSISSTQYTRMKVSGENKCL